MSTQGLQSTKQQWNTKIKVTTLYMPYRKAEGISSSESGNYGKNSLPFMLCFFKSLPSLINVRDHLAFLWGVWLLIVSPHSRLQCK